VMPSLHPMHRYSTTVTVNQPTFQLAPHSPHLRSVSSVSPLNTWGTCSNETLLCTPPFFYSVATFGIIRMADPPPPFVHACLQQRQLLLLSATSHRALRVLRVDNLTRGVRFSRSEQQLALFGGANSRSFLTLLDVRTGRNVGHHWLWEVDCERVRYIVGLNTW
jgi:hypothetical protein